MTYGNPTPEFLTRLIDPVKVTAWFQERGLDMMPSQTLALTSLMTANWPQHAHGGGRGCDVILFNLGQRSGKSLLATALVETHPHVAFVLNTDEERHRVYVGQTDGDTMRRVLTEAQFKDHHREYKLAIYDWDHFYRGRPETLVKEPLPGMRREATIKGRVNTGDLTVWLI